MPDLPRHPDDPTRFDAAPADLIEYALLTMSEEQFAPILQQVADQMGGFETGDPELDALERGE